MKSSTTPEAKSPFFLINNYYHKTRTFMSSVVQNYFTGSYKEMVSFFVRDRKLSKSDLQDLMDQIEKEE